MIGQGGGRSRWQRSCWLETHLVADSCSWKETHQVEKENHLVADYYSHLPHNVRLKQSEDEI